MLEKQVQSRILKWLKEQGIVRVKTIVLAESGYPDIVGVIPPDGKSLWIEVKRPGAKPDKMQLYRIKKLREAGAVAFWTDSLDEVKKRLSPFLK